jgi:hypothetical protein
VPTQTWLKSAPVVQILHLVGYECLCSLLSLGELAVKVLFLLRMTKAITHLALSWKWVPVCTKTSSAMVPLCPPGIWGLLAFLGIGKLEAGKLSGRRWRRRTATTKAHLHSRWKCAPTNLKLSSPVAPLRPPGLGIWACLFSWLSACWQ